MKGTNGSSVSFHEGGKPGHRTWLVIASGPSPESLAADIQECAAGRQDEKRSSTAPDITVRADGGLLHLTAEAGELKTLVPAIVSALAAVQLPATAE